MSGGEFTRRALAGGVLAAGGLLAGCDRLASAPQVIDLLSSAEGLTRRAQRLALGAQPLAREFQARDLSPTFKANGSTAPADPAYVAAAAANFVNWRLGVDGLVRQPLSLSLDQIKALPGRTQITRHDCVEGWSAIGQWTGAKLGAVLAAAGLAPTARFVVFHCADDYTPSTDGSGRYYESIDLIDAFHPQTILAYEMNGQPLSIAHGAPLRLRVERQLGYKQAKYIMRIQVADRLQGIRGGKGGYWEDHNHYEWYAGI